MGDRIGEGSIFRQIHGTFQSRGSTEHLRGKDEDRSLYLHPWYHFSGSSEEALKGRQQKFEVGSDIVITVLDRDYGENVRRQVMQNIQHDLGDPDQEGVRNIEKEMLRGDLNLIMDEVGGKTPYRGELGNVQHEQMQVYRSNNPGQIFDPDGCRALLSNLFGRQLSDDEIRGLGGIPDGCDVALVPTELFSRKHLNCGGGQGVTIAMAGEDPSGMFREITTTVYPDRRGKPLLLQDSIERTQQQGPKNLGCCVVVRQMDIARTLGVGCIHSFALRGGQHNGYYTWARCGGNQPLREEKFGFFDKEEWMDKTRPQPGTVYIREQDREQFEHFWQAIKEPDRYFNVVVGHHKINRIPLELTKEQFVEEMQGLSGKRNLDVQDLMQTESGRAFWRAYGFTVPLEFKLNDPKSYDTFMSYTVPNSCFEFR